MAGESGAKREKERKEMSTETNVAVKQGTRTSVRTIVQVGMLGALATILMMFDFPLPFAPSFYKIDLSEVPVLIGCFALGPVEMCIRDRFSILPWHYAEC